jgi:transcriptional regulator with XRE-family HTH domain
MGAENQLTRLRFLVKRRIDAGEFTTSELALRVGLSEPTISNFVNGRRGAKRSTVDLYRTILGISDQDLQEPSLPSAHLEAEMVPIVRHAVAMKAARITNDLSLGDSHIQVKSFSRFRCKPTMDREGWTRFVAVTITRSQVRFLKPRFADGALLFIDRYDQRLNLEESETGKLYAVNHDGVLGIGYLQPIGDDLLLKPNFPGMRSERIRLDGKHSASYFIIGRICHVSTDV